MALPPQYRMSRGGNP